MKTLTYPFEVLLVTEGQKQTYSIYKNADYVVASEKQTVIFQQYIEKTTEDEALKNLLMQVIKKRDHQRNADKN